MRKLLSALLLGASALAAAQSTEQSYILVGSYTDEVHTDGIYTLSFNPQNGALKRVGNTQNVRNPSYLAWSKNRDFLYAVNENSSQNDEVSAFRFDKRNGSLSFINRQPVNGSAACFKRGSACCLAPST